MSARTVTKKKRSVKKSTELTFSFSEADVKRVSENLKEPGWLASRRLQAWKRFLELPMPTMKEEPWRRTDIRTLPAEKLTVKAAENGKVDPSLLQPLTAQEGALMVLRPGHDPELRGDHDPAKQGVVFADWATAVREHATILKRHLGTVVPDDDGKFSALAASLAEDGVLLYVPKGAQLTQPLHAVFLPEGVDTAFFSRVLVVVDDGASATLVHETASDGRQDGDALHAGVVEIYVGQEAQFTFIEVQNLGKHVWNFTHERAKVQRDGRMEWIFGGVGSRLTKNFSDLDLLGSGAEGRMSAFYFADGEQHLDHDTQQNHLAPHTTSDLLFKGALLERSRSVWQGMIYVAPGAQQTDGYQANRNLLLSKTARADSIPGLEILADDVRCTHGATVGQLEAEPIFYLMSRGLSRQEAERLVIDGFFASVMERIPFEGVRHRFKQMIDKKLANLVS